MDEILEPLFGKSANVKAVSMGEDGTIGLIPEKLPNVLILTMSRRFGPVERACIICPMMMQGTLAWKESVCTRKQRCDSKASEQGIIRDLLLCQPRTMVLQKFPKKTFEKLRSGLRISTKHRLEAAVAREDQGPTGPTERGLGVEAVRRKLPITQMNDNQVGARWARRTVFPESGVKSQIN